MKRIPIGKILNEDQTKWVKQGMAYLTKDRGILGWGEANNPHYYPKENLYEDQFSIKWPTKKGTDPIILVPEGSTPEAALDAFKNFASCFDQGELPWNCPLSGSEKFTLYEQGKKAIEPWAIQFPGMSDKDLRTLVFELCDGAVLTDKQVPANLLAMVFMPLMLGGLSVPDDVLEKIKNLLPPNPGPEPEIKKRPLPPILVMYPEPPREPEIPIPDPQRVAELEFQISWQTATPAELETYKAKIKQKADAIKKDWEQEVAETEVRREEVAVENAALLKTLAETTAAWEAETASFPAQHLEWQLAEVRHSQAYKGVYEEWIKNIGAIYEHISEAGPRGVNGFPIFFSFHTAGKEDWIKIMKAVQKETKRREKVKI